MSYFSGLISTIFERRYQKALSNEADARITPQLCEALLSSHGKDTERVSEYQKIR